MVWFQQAKLVLAGTPGWSDHASWEWEKGSIGQSQVPCPPALPWNVQSAEMVNQEFQILNPKSGNDTKFGFKKKTRNFGMFMDVPWTISLSKNLNNSPLSFHTGQGNQPWPRRNLTKNMAKGEPGVPFFWYQKSLHFEWWVNQSWEIVLEKI